MSTISQFQITFDQDFVSIANPQLTGYLMRIQLYQKMGLLKYHPSEKLATLLRDNLD
jgi:hypothetical protein